MGMAIPKTENFWDEHMSHGSNVSFLSNGGGTSNSASAMSVVQGMSQSTPATSSSCNNNEIPQHPRHHHQYERNLNFSTAAVMDEDFCFQRKKSARDPLSHRIIEKRRRDRMNNCLADLARLLPQSSLRKGRGRIEKTEIVELAIKHLKHLQCHPCPQGGNCEFNQIRHKPNVDDDDISEDLTRTAAKCLSHTARGSESKVTPQDLEQFRLGYEECIKHTLHFLMETGNSNGGDKIVVQLLEFLNRKAESISDNLTSIQVNNNNELRIQSFRFRDCAEALPEHYDESDFPSKNIGGRGGCESSVSKHESSISKNRLEFVRNIDNKWENDSCSSPPFSLNMSDGLSCDDKLRSCMVKPPLPSLVGSHSPTSSVLFGSSTGRSSDEGSVSMSLHRYKFKSNIKQRFSADLETSKRGHTEAAGNWNARPDPLHVVNGHFLNPRAAHKQEKSEDTNSSNHSTDDLQIDEDHQDPETVETFHAEIFEESNIDKGEMHGRLVEPEGLEDNDEFDFRRGNRQSPPDSNSTILPIFDLMHPELNRIKIETNRDESLSASPPYEDTQPSRFSAAEEGTNERRSYDVPAFALHYTGSFYVPLTLDRRLLAPYESVINFNHSHPLPLHPITISVCFNTGSKEEFHSSFRQSSRRLSYLSIGNKTEARNFDTANCLSSSPHIVAGFRASGTTDSSRLGNQQNFSDLQQHRRSSMPTSLSSQLMERSSVLNRCHSSQFEHSCKEQHEAPFITTYELTSNHVLTPTPSNLSSGVVDRNRNTSSTSSNSVESSGVSSNSRQSRKRHLGTPNLASFGFNSWSGNSLTTISTTEPKSEEISITKLLEQKSETVNANCVRIACSPKGGKKATNLTRKQRKMNPSAVLSRRAPPKSGNTN